jgi:SAM-dependent methyltransferase
MTGSTRAVRSIFVAIASYRDPDLSNTLTDLFAKADAPDALTVGICLQSVPDEDADCRAVSPRPEQMRVIEFHAKDSQGACWARAQTLTLLGDEEGFFQIDSHMRFAQGWDRRLWEMLDTAPSPKPLLSTYPLSFEPPDTFSPDRYITIYPKGFDNDGVLLQRSTGTSPEDAPKDLAATAHIGAGLLFGPAQMMREVPYDPYLYFQGEEITLAARFWTHGWDIFTPNQVVAYHDYTKRPARPRHWEDQENWASLRQRAAKRLKTMLGMEAQAPASDDPALIEFDRYGLGSTRSLEAYEAFSGLDFRARLIGGAPGVLPDRGPERDDECKRRQRIFTSIWSKNTWKNDESRSGGGSTMAATRSIRPKLAALFRDLDIEILADAGCGDVNWIGALTDPLRLYLGYDIVAEAVDAARDRLGRRSNCLFDEADVVTETLPRCDAILCRDVLTHLPSDAALMALRRFRTSGSRYLIATTHSIGRNRWVAAGGWYTSDLSAPPFSLPEPLIRISEDLPGTSKALGVWRLDALEMIERF